jgi:hypothetical protein
VARHGAVADRRREARCAGARYVIELYRELTVENGAPTLGSQNQAVDFIRDDPQLRRAVAAWAKNSEIDEATTMPRQRLPFDALNNQVRAFLERTMAPLQSFADRR